MNHYCSSQFGITFCNLYPVLQEQESRLIEVSTIFVNGIIDKTKQIILTVELQARTGRQLTVTYLNCIQFDLVFVPIKKLIGDFSHEVQCKINLIRFLLYTSYFLHKIIKNAFISFKIKLNKLQKCRQAL